MVRGLIIISVVFLMGCSTVVTEYDYVDGKAHAVKRIRLRGIGKAKVNDKGFEISSEPWVKIPSLPKIELDN